MLYVDCQREQHHVFINQVTDQDDGTHDSDTECHVSLFSHTISAPSHVVINQVRVWSLLASQAIQQYEH